MPGHPVSHLIVPQAGLPLGPLKALLDAMCRLGNARQFFQRDVWACIRQVIIKFEAIIRLTLPRYEQQLLGASSSSLSPSLYPTFHRVDHQRSFLPVTHLDLSPGVRRQGRAPFIQTHEWRLPPWPTSGVLRRCCLDVANQCVRGDCEQIALAKSTQFQAKTAGPAHLVVAGNPGVWQRLTTLREHLQCQLVPGLKLDGLGYSGLLATRSVLGPVLVKIKTYINNRMFFPREVAHVDTHLAVVDLAEPATPLLGDPHRLGPFLGKPRGVKHDYAVGFAQLLADLGCQCPEHRLMVPRNLSNELLNPLPLLIKQVVFGWSLGSDRFRIFSAQAKGAFQCHEILPRVRFGLEQSGESRRQARDALGAGKAKDRRGWPRYRASHSTKNSKSV